MKCYDDPHIMQNFIYTMNDYNIRNKIMKYHIKNANKSDSHQWLGTWTLYQNKNNKFLFKDVDPLFSSIKISTDTPFPDFLSKMKKKLSLYPVSVFTVCLVYDQYLVHFVSFIYLSKEKLLISFDSGIEIYHHGQDTIVPYIQTQFKKYSLTNNNHYPNLGRCKHFRWKGKYMGLQFTGMEESPDAFCQSWTIYFLVRFLYSGFSISHKQHLQTLFQFVNDWCKINPKKRAMMLTENFIIPVLLFFPDVLKHLKKLTSYNDNAVLIHHIITPAQKCRN